MVVYWEKDISLTPSFTNHFLECGYSEVCLQGDESVHSDLDSLKYFWVSLSNLMPYGEDAFLIIIWAESCLSYWQFRCYVLETDFHNIFQVLTLASNERIPLTSSMRLVFETSHLRMATPATVSRAGILYINPQDLGWNPWVTQFVFSQYQSIFKVFSEMFFFSMFSLRFIYCAQCMEVTKCSFHYTVNLCVPIHSKDSQILIGWAQWPIIIPWIVA